MYDDLSLQQLLEVCGFDEVQVQTPTDSLIDGWDRLYLDTDPDGLLWLPNRLYMEAVQTITPITDVPPRRACLFIVLGPPEPRASRSRVRKRGHILRTREQESQPHHFPLCEGVRLSYPRSEDRSQASSPQTHHGP